MKTCSISRRVFSIAAALFAAAASPSAAGEPLRNLHQGLDSAARKPNKLVVRSASQWVNVWNTHYRAATPDSSPPVPNVDWSREMVLVAFMGTCPSGGHSIRIGEARVEKGALIVTVVEQRPGPNSITTQALTSPYHAVALARTSLPIKWKTVQVKK